MTEAANPRDPRGLVAVDLGAESCRVSVLRWAGGEPTITLVHRFSNQPLLQGDALHWDLGMILRGVDEGLRKAAELATEGLRSLAVDGWAVDYVWLDASGEPLADPFCYRDLRTLAAEQLLFRHISADRLRELTAIQPLRINTLFQLFADRLASNPPGVLWLNLPEYVLHWLGGRAVSEWTSAGHTQLVDAATDTWSKEIFKAANLDLACAPPLVATGSGLGYLTGPLAHLPAFVDTLLIAPACHDTASAIAGIPAQGDDWAYISSGTWSLVGTLVPRAIWSAKAAADGFTNLAAAGGDTCFHVNVNGMWLIKQCMVEWESAGHAWDIVGLVAAAEREPAPAHLLHVDEPDLLLPGAMIERINLQLTRAGHAPLSGAPENAPTVANLIFHSLAARYAQVLAQVAEHTAKPLRRVFVVGGGSRNEYLNRLLAEASGLEVHRGSPESSTLGNFAMQMAVLEGGDHPGAGRLYAWAARLGRARLL
jgi:rhamnulokinase